MSIQKTFVTGDKYFNSYAKYSPNDLIKIAHDMKDDGILSVEFCPKEDHVYFECGRMETQEEADLRMSIEKQRDDKSREWNEKTLKKLAEQLNYKIEKIV